MLTFTWYAQPIGLRSMSSVHGSSTLKEPVESRVHAIGLATMMLSSASTTVTVGVKVITPRAAFPYGVV